MSDPGLKELENELGKLLNAELEKTPSNIFDAVPSLGAKSKTISPSRRDKRGVKKTLQQVIDEAALREATLPHHYVREPYAPLSRFRNSLQGTTGLLGLRPLNEFVNDAGFMYPIPIEMEYGDKSGLVYTDLAEHIMYNEMFWQDEMGDLVDEIYFQHGYHRDKEDPFVKPLTYSKKEDHMGENQPKLPFMSDKLDHLVTYTNLFESESKYFKSVNLGHRIIADMEAFLTGLDKMFPDDVQKFRQKSAEPQQYVMYIRSNDVLVKLILESVSPQEWYSDKDTEACSKVYKLQIEYLGDLKLHCKLMDYLRSFDLYEFPRKEGVYDVNISDMFVNPGNGALDTMEYHMTTEDFDDVLLSLYPGIDMRAFLTAYHQSDENIAIFQGPPGTGKTSLLKLILRDCAQMNKEDTHSIYVKDRKALHMPAFWSFMSSRRHIDFLILDDLDYDLLPRESTEYQNYVKEQRQADTRTAEEILTEERSRLELSKAKAQETIVNQLLSYSDGLFQSTTKVIITTNLEYNKIDKALIRPGRCFDILKFPYMTIEHSLRIWKEEFKLSDDQFKACFAEKLDEKGPAISQALLVSEAKELERKTLKGSYLIDKSISVRNKYM